MNGKSPTAKILHLCALILAMNLAGQLLCGQPESHDPVTITGDIDFTVTNLVREGQGTANDPYQIYNWEIDGTGENFCLLIQDTTKHFVVRNCTFTSASQYGLRLKNVVNGTVRDNTCTGNETGILLESGSGNLVENNTCTDNVTGILLYSTYDNTISYNQCNDNDINGIYLYASTHHNRLLYNECVSNEGRGIGFYC